MRRTDGRALASVAALLGGLLATSPVLASPIGDDMNTVLPFSGPGGDGPSMVSTTPAGLMRLPWGWYLHVEGLGRMDQY